MPTPLASAAPPLAVVLAVGLDVVFAGLDAPELAFVEPAVPDEDDPPPQAARNTAPARRTEAGARLDMDLVMRFLSSTLTPPILTNVSLSPRPCTVGLRLARKPDNHQIGRASCRERV